MYFYTQNEYECSGCTACVNVCAHAPAITMEKNDEGFLYPIRHDDLCVKCGLCEKVCPFEHPIYKNDAPTVYAAYDKMERSGSSSGGLFYTIASYVINCGGVVFGAACNKDLKVRHICARTLQELQPLRGSKYVQSELGDCYEKIKDELKKGTLVYFTGVGCQVAGLYAFLRKDYKNLVTSDIVCHGVPSQYMFDVHLSFLKDRYKSRVKSYSFREKEYWLTREEVEFENGRMKRKYDGNMSPFLYSFGLGYISRYSCFNCIFAKIPRQGDMFLADFWGVEEAVPGIDTSKGVSLVLLNNGKGRKIWDEIKENLVCYESTLEAAIKYNPNVVRPTKEPDFRKDFFKILRKIGYSQMATTILSCPPEMRNRRIELKMVLSRWHLYWMYYYAKRYLKIVLKNLKLK